MPSRKQLGYRNNASNRRKGKDSKQKQKHEEKNENILN